MASQIKKDLNLSKDILQVANYKRNARVTDSAASGLRKALSHRERSESYREQRNFPKIVPAQETLVSTNSTARGRAVSARDRGICSQKEFSTQRKKSILIENFTDISKDDNCKRNALFHKQQRAASAQARGIRACARHPRLTAASVRRKSLSHRERSQSYRELYRHFQR